MIEFLKQLIQMGENNMDYITKSPYKAFSVRFR